MVKNPRKITGKSKIIIKTPGSGDSSRYLVACRRRAARPEATGITSAETAME
jgi:hypothetical protein